MFDTNSDVSVVLTSCGRFDLLHKTICSFIQCNTYPLNEFVLVEDSGDESVVDAIPVPIRDKIRIIVNETNIGQIESIDKAYKTITSKYIFHCEDDWEFYRPGFVEDSKTILDRRSDVLQVWLRSFHHDIRYRHPYFVLGDGDQVSGIEFRKLQSNESNWGSFTFNPGLRRLADYQMLGSYQKMGSERSISEEYRRLGKCGVILENDAVMHIGWGQHLFSRKQKKHKRKKIELVAAYALLLVLAGFTIGLLV